MPQIIDNYLKRNLNLRKDWICPQYKAWGDSRKGFVRFVCNELMVRLLNWELVVKTAVFEIILIYLSDVCLYIIINKDMIHKYFCFQYIDNFMKRIKYSKKSF